VSAAVPALDHSELIAIEITDSHRTKAAKLKDQMSRVES
jgi:hypothetical protein